MLKARWEIGREAEGGVGGGCDVKLHIELQYRNPLYAALSTAIGPKVVKAMIEAFERRAKEIVEPEEERGIGEAARGSTLDVYTIVHGLGGGDIQ